MQKRFTRRKEDFICAHCKTAVVGDGYTNHCPECLWSKHVDIAPGDRLSECQALMQPITIESMKGKYRVTHECEKCKHRKANTLSENDNMDVVISISTAIAKKFST